MRGLFYSSLLAATLCAAPGQALELDPDVVPEINLGGTLITTLKFASTDPVLGDGDDDVEMEFADSTVLMGVSKYLFNDRAYGFADFGLYIPEDDSDFEDDLFVNQLAVGIGVKAFEVKLGRSNLGNTLVTFPTIRDSDLLEFTHVLNPHLNGEGEEFQVYGGIARARIYFGTSPWSLLFQGTARATSDLNNLASTSRDSTNSFNGGAVGVTYLVPEDIKFDRGVRYAGLLADTSHVDRIGRAGKETMTSVVAGTIVNLSEDPARSWVVDLQGIWNDGTSVPTLASEAERAQASSWSAVMGLRYVSRPFLQTRWQAAITGAYKDYDDFSGAESFAIVPSFAWRLGSGIEAVAQYRYLNEDGALAAARNRSEDHALWLGFTFRLSGTFNESVGQRGSILHLEHNMLDLGPVRRGH